MGDVIGLLQEAGFQTFVTSGIRQLTPVDTTFSDGAAHELVAVRDLEAFTRRTGWRPR